MRSKAAFYPLVSWLVLNAACVFGQSKPAVSSSVLAADGNRIPYGTAIIVDGKVGAKEWDDAKIVEFEVETGWVLKIFFKQDAVNLYFRFSNLKLAEKKEFYPEVLIDTRNTKTKAWERGQWWFHTSYSNIEGNGIFNEYMGMGKGPRTGWNGNNFPLDVGGHVEMSVSKALISVKSGDMIGLAFDVTDTRNKWFYYPSTAKIEMPETWASFRL